MKRYIFFFVVLISFFNKLSPLDITETKRDFFQFKNDDDITIFFTEVDRLSYDLYQIMESYHESERYIINFFHLISDLTSHVLTVNSQSFSNSGSKINIAKESEAIYSIYSQMICDFLTILELNKIELSSLSPNLKLENLLQLQQSKTRETKMVVLKSLMDKKEVEKINALIHEFSSAFSVYLNNEIKNFVNDAQGKLYLYLCSMGNESDEPLIFRKGGKKRRIFSAIFGAIGDACISLVNLISSKNNKDKKDNILNLCGTAINLISDINSMKNSESVNGANASTQNAQNNNSAPAKPEIDKKDLTKIEQEYVIDLAVQTIEDLYLILKKENMNINIDPESKKFLMDNLDVFTSPVERKVWIENTLKNKNLSEKLLTSVFKCLKKCLQEAVEQVVEVLFEKMLDIMVEYAHSKT
jgi:hypothetical protein